MNVVDRPHFVYTAWDVDGWCLYVGCTVDVDTRMGQHSFTSAWHPYAVSVEISLPMSYADARAYERERIAALAPQFNREANADVVFWAHSEYNLALAEACERGDALAAADAFACLNGVGPLRRVSVAVDPARRVEELFACLDDATAALLRRRMTRRVATRRFDRSAA